MEMTKQITIFLENKPGRLANVLASLATEKINITALTVMDRHEHSVLRIVTDDFAKTAKVAETLNTPYTEAEVCRWNCNQPGGWLTSVKSWPRSTSTSITLTAVRAAATARYWVFSRCPMAKKPFACSALRPMNAGPNANQPAINARIRHRRPMRPNAERSSGSQRKNRKLFLRNNTMNRYLVAALTGLFLQPACCRLVAILPKPSKWWGCALPKSCPMKIAN